jgi:hypothetical protein
LWEFKTTTGVINSGSLTSTDTINGGSLTTPNAVSCGTISCSGYAGIGILSLSYRCHVKMSLNDLDNLINMLQLYGLFQMARK